MSQKRKMERRLDSAAVELSTKGPVLRSYEDALYELRKRRIVLEKDSVGAAVYAQIIDGYQRLPEDELVSHLDKIAEALWGPTVS